MRSRHARYGRHNRRPRGVRSHERRDPDRVLGRRAHPQVEVPGGARQVMCRHGVPAHDQDSTPCSMNADNMSRKSGLSTTVSGKGPRVERELPHHAQSFRGSPRAPVLPIGAFVRLDAPNERGDDVGPSWQARPGCQLMSGSPGFRRCRSVRRMSSTTLMLSSVASSVSAVAFTAPIVA
jgi:hypothetical protein